MKKARVFKYLVINAAGWQSFFLDYESALRECNSQVHQYMEGLYFANHPYPTIYEVNAKDTPWLEN